MTGRVLRFDPSAHKVVDALLPWYVNGTLEGDEREYVRAHLEECAQCRQEAEWQRELHAACVAADSAPGAANPLRNLRRHLTSRAPKRSLSARIHHGWRRSSLSTRWGVAAALAGALVTLAVSGVPDIGGPALYHTLGASGRAAHAGGSIVVVFDPATTEAELRRILRETGARLVDGPTQTNAYILDVPAEKRQDAMQVLRNERAVVLVARLSSENAP